MKTYERRTFLAGLAAAPLVYGLREVLGGPEEEHPEWLEAGLKRMKASGRWGVVLVLPPPKDRFTFGQALWALTAFPETDHEAHRIFCEAVFFVMLPELAAKHFAVPATTTRILLSPEGKVLASDAERVYEGDPNGFAEAFRPFLHGKDNRRLIDRAAELESRLSPELRAALDKLGSESAEESLAARLVLGRNMESLTIVLANVAETSPVERARLRAGNLLTSYFASQDAKAPGGKVPFGASGPHYYDPCRGCGMARISDRSRMFLGFLIPGEKPVCENE